MRQLSARGLQHLIAITTFWVATPLVLAQGTAPPPAVPAEVAASTTPPTPPPEPVAEEASSYSIGLTFGNQLRTGGLEHAVQLDAVMHGLKEGLGGKVVSTADRDRSTQLLRVGRAAEAARNRAAARDFLAKNSSVAKVKSTASGLQYIAFSAGDAKAASPTLNDRVTVNYRGRLIDGTEFDNSDSHPQAATFGLGGVIKGWREALLLMKPRAKWRLFVPPALAYDNFTPPSIPPGSLLIFDLELLKIEPPPVMGKPDTKGGPDLKQPAAKRPSTEIPNK